MRMVRIRTINVDRESWWQPTNAGLFSTDFTISSLITATRNRLSLAVNLN